MKRGDIVLCADRSGDYTSKPRPVVVVQNSAYIPGIESLIVCPLSTVPIDDPLAMKLTPAPHNGLKESCTVRADKISAVKKSRIGKRIGSMAPDELRRLDEIIRAWLAL